MWHNQLFAVVHVIGAAVTFYCIIAMQHMNIWDPMGDNHFFFRKVVQKTQWNDVLNFDFLYNGKHRSAKHRQIGKVLYTAIYNDRKA